MKLHYDLHIHSALSPCGDNDMTPNNLVNMAKLSGLDIIALTDHNSCRNCPAAVAVGEAIGLMVVPGMELCTAEDIHVVCLLPDLKTADAFSEHIHSILPPIVNRPAVFGDQLVMDVEDYVIDTEQTLLITAAGIGIDKVRDLVLTYGGACFPAHIDKDAYSVLASLGDIPPEAGFTAAEISRRGNVEALKAAHPTLQNMPLLLDSDAHMLDQMQDAGPWIDLPVCSAQALIDGLNGPPIAWAR